MSYSEWVKGRETGYIDRAKLLNEMEHECENCEFRDSDGYECEECDYAHAMLYVKAQKAIKMQPVKHGRWKPAKNGDEEYLYLSTILGIPVEDLPKYAYCSECHFSFATNGVDKTGKALIHKAVYKYCPNCGAKMDDTETIKG